jgi:hypothetical protein
MIKGVPDGMKGVFEGLSQKNGESYKLLSRMAGMTKTLAASLMILKVLRKARKKVKNCIAY